MPPGELQRTLATNKEQDDEVESEWMWVGNGRSTEYIAKAIVRTNSAIIERTGVEATPVGDFVPGMPDEDVVSILRAELEQPI